MFVRFLLCAVVALTPAFADTLTLKNGKVVEGTFLGGDSRQIRMAVGDRVDSFYVNDISALKFGTSASQTAASSTSSTSATEASTSSAAASTTPARASTSSAPASSRQAQSTASTSSTASERSTATASRELGVVLVPVGGEVVVRMIDDVDSSRDTVGQKYRASLDEPVMVDGVTKIARGADVIVKLVDDKQSGRLTGKTELTLDISSITINGREVDVVSEDVVMASESRTAETAKRAGGLAAVGAVIGAIAGGGKGAAIGAATGAGVGTGVQVATKGEKVRIPSETRLTFILKQPIRI